MSKTNQDKLRLYIPNQKNLNVIKKHLKKNKMKSNNSTAVYFAVNNMAENIKTNQEV